MRISLFILLVCFSCADRSNIESNESLDLFVNSILNDNVLVLTDSLLFLGYDSNYIIAKNVPFKEKSELNILQKKNNGFLVQSVISQSTDLEVNLNNHNNVLFFKNVLLDSLSNPGNYEYSLSTSFDTLRLQNLNESLTHYKSDILDVNDFLGYDARLLIMNSLIERGIFFKTSGNLYIWIFDKTIFFIRSKFLTKGDYILYHVLQSNNFVNLDFTFNQHLSNKLLLSDNFEVAQLQFDSSIFERKIRIGEYCKNFGKNENLWVQDIDMNEVYNNELLIFNNEIE